MDRAALINQLFQKSHLLKVDNPDYRKTVESLFTWLKVADHVENDITSRSLRNETNIDAVVKTHQDVVLAGVEEIELLLNKLPKISFKEIRNDGEKVKKGDVVLMLTGDVYTILSLERVILNILGRMSGIATQTNKFVQVLKNSPFIAATRKTPWMLMDKKAVAVGGGLTHRLDLSDGFLYKDNHLQIIREQYNLATEAEAVIYALRNVIDNNQNNNFIEIEATTKESILVAIEAFAKKPNQNGIIMFDNWSSKETKEFIENIKTDKNYSRILFESSGNINEGNLKDWATSGVDVISSGALTHSSPNADLSMEIN